MLAVYLTPVYIAVNIYLLIQILQWLDTCNMVFRKWEVRITMGLVYWFLAFAMLIAFFLPMGQGRRVLKLIGNYWLGILLYLLLLVLTADLLRFFRIWSKKNRKIHARAGLVCAAILAGICAWGLGNARIIHVTPYEITVNKDGGNLDHLKVVLAADLHLGYNVGISHMKNMVKKINAQDADLVVIAGDIFDNEYEALENPAALACVLREIQSKYGVYACYGNHDVEEGILAGFTFGGKEKKVSSVEMDEFLKEAEIHLLQDEAVLIEDSFYLYGRPDAERPGRGIEERKSAEEIMKELDTQKPVLVIDHEPRELKELSEAGADVDLSGHTHDGQLFPANIVTDFLWENPCGYVKKGNMHSIVTSGVGIFGPNMRVGTTAEICSILINFQQSGI